MLLREKSDANVHGRNRCRKRISTAKRKNNITGLAKNFLVVGMRKVA
jgi:hypothetical protein